jgi:Ni/Co efflux regulator RcnB
MKKAILTAVALLSLAAPAAASAQVQRAVLQGGDTAQLITVDDDRRGRGRGEWRREHRREWRDDRRNYRHGYRDGRHDGRRHDRHVYVQPRYYAPPVRYYAPPARYYAPPVHYGYRPGYAYGHQPRWHRGGHLPHGYHSWYVRDYYNYGWAPPPPGYGYYRSNTGEIILAAVATGLILSVIAGGW